MKNDIRVTSSVHHRLRHLAMATAGALVLPVAGAIAIGIDAPGPGYREQRWRLVESPGPEYLHPTHDVHPAHARPLFDGEAPKRVQIHVRGEFKLLWDNPGWDFEVYDQPVFFEPTAPLKVERSVPLQIMERLAPGIHSEVRLPYIPEVILPRPRELNWSLEERPPFQEPGPVGLRVRDRGIPIRD